MLTHVYNYKYAKTRLCVPFTRFFMGPCSFRPDATAKGFDLLRPFSKHGPRRVKLIDDTTGDSVQKQYNVFENQKVVINCQSSDANPSANITWHTHSNKTGSIDYDVAPTVCSGAYRLQKCSKKITFLADRKHHMSRLECIATNPVAYHLIARGEVEVTVMFGPEKTSLLTSIDYALPGEVVHLKCYTDEVYPNASVHWQHDITWATIIGREDYVLENFFQGVKTYVSFSSLIFNASQADNGKSVICHAQNIIPGIPRVSSELKINIAYGPETLRYVFPGVHTCSPLTCAVPVGTVFIIQCVTDDVSPAVRMEIEFTNKTFSWREQPKIRTDVNLSYRATLALNVTSHYDGSSVTCEAKNAVRLDKVQSIKTGIDVLVGPTLVIIRQSGGRWGPNNSIIVKQDSSVNLTCVTDFTKEGVDMTLHLYNPSSRRMSCLPHAGLVEVARGIYKYEIILFITSEEHGIHITCKASNKKSDYLSASASVVMDVIAGPRRIATFRCWGGRFSRRGACMLMLGARVTLYCSTDSSFQQVIFRFQFRLKSGKTFEAYGTNGGKYVLDVSKDYHLSTVWCLASNVREPSLRASSSLEIKITGGPPRGPHTVDMLLRGTNASNDVVVVSNGVVLEVVCRSGVANSGSHINIRLVTVDGAVKRLVTRGLRAFDNNTNEATSSSVVTDDYHAGTIECVAINTRAPKLKASTSRILDITVGPHDLTIESVDKLSEVDGDVIVAANATKATIRCVAKVHPAGKISLYSHMVISAEPTVVTRKSGDTLVEKQLSFTRYMNHEKEVFTCSVANTRDPSMTASVSKKLKVVVHGKWSNWLQWETCSSTCGLGTQIRIRECTSPPPSDNGGNYCLGPNKFFKSCLQEMPCDPYKQKSDYLRNHVVNASETNVLIILVITICATSFIVMFTWYLRDAYLEAQKEAVKEDMGEFDVIFTKLLRLVRMRKVEEGGDKGDCDRQSLIDELRRNDECPVVGRFLDVCDRLTDEETTKRQRNAEITKKRYSINLLKHELNKLALMMSLRSEDKQTIEDALRTYKSTATKLKEQDQQDDYDLLENTRNMILALSLKSTIDEMERVHDLEGVERMLSVVVGKGLCGVLDAFRTAKERLETLRAMSNDRKFLLELSKTRINEFKCYRDPPRAVRATLIASLLILGVNEKDMNSWLSCMQICNSSKGFDWRLKNFRLDQLRPTVAVRALDILNMFSPEDVKVVSETAYHIYRWAHTIATHRLSMRRGSERRRSSQSERLVSIIEKGGT